MKVKYFTVLRELIGKKEEEIELKRATTVGDLIALIAQRHGREVESYLYDADGKVKSFLQFLVNGKSIATLGGLETKLTNGDIVAIIPPVGGG